MPIIKPDTERLVKTLAKMGRPYFFHAGFALYLLGLEASYDDLDVFISSSDLQETKAYLESNKYDSKIAGTVNYGNGLVLNDRLKINQPEADICNEMRIDSDFGPFRFPTEYALKTATSINVDGTAINVAILEFLFLYYLVLRRTDNGKNDYLVMSNIHKNQNFDEQDFRSLLRLINNRFVEELYEEAKKSWIQT